MSRLPTALARWEESLAGLDAVVARAVGPMLPMLDVLIGRLDRHGGDLGELDGYDGTTNRGDFDRLLMDEWLIADELPDEFVRRAAEHELSFLRLARRSESPRGAVAAVVDTGPEQLGVGRLVQLAALIVLHRRAIEIGAELSVVLLGPRGRDAGFVAGATGPPEAAVTRAPAPVVAGPDGLPSVLLGWLDARSTHQPTAHDVAAAFDAVGAQDRVWLLAGPTVRSHAPPRYHRSVSSQIARWDDAGVGRLAVRVGDSTGEVEVPDPPAAVAALRGGGLRRRLANATVASVLTTGGGAVFHSGDTRLLWRGTSAEEIYASFVSRESKVRRYRLDGSVVAVNSLGKRVVAAVTDGSAMWIQVIGKKLGHTDRIHVRLADLQLDATTLETLLTQPPRPLHLQGKNILISLPSGWWALDGQDCSATGFRAVGPGHALDSPTVVLGTETGGFAVGESQLTDLVIGPVLGPAPSDPHHGAWVAWSNDSRTWQVARGREVVDQIAVEEKDRIIGLGLVEQHPFLLVTSESGRLVRQVSSRKVRTWTRWAGPAHFSLHPHRMWLARTNAGRITVGDLRSGETLLEIKAPS